MVKKRTFSDSIMRARYLHMNTDMGHERIERLEEVVEHLMFCLEEVQRNGKRLTDI